jgi:hypothetical protein
MATDKTTPGNFTQDEDYDTASKNRVIDWIPNGAKRKWHSHVYFGRAVNVGFLVCPGADSGRNSTHRTEEVAKKAKAAQLRFTQIPVYSGPLRYYLFLLIAFYQEDVKNICP